MRHQECVVRSTTTTTTTQPRRQPALLLGSGAWARALPPPACSCLPCLLPRAPLPCCKLLGGRWCRRPSSSPRKVAAAPLLVLAIACSINAEQAVEEYDSTYRGRAVAGGYDDYDRSSTYYYCTAVLGNNILQ